MHVVYHVFVMNSAGEPQYLGCTESFTEAMRVSEPLYRPGEEPGRPEKFLHDQQVFHGICGGMERLITRHVYKEPPVACSLCGTPSERDELALSLNGEVCEECIEDYDMRECEWCGRLAMLEELDPRSGTCASCQTRTVF